MDGPIVMNDLVVVGHVDGGDLLAPALDVVRAHRDRALAHVVPAIYAWYADSPPQGFDAELKDHLHPGWRKP